MTGEAKGATHIDDATAAVECFVSALPDPTTRDAFSGDRPLSLIGLAALWSGWTQDRQVVHAPCLALKATKAV